MPRDITTNVSTGFSRWEGVRVAVESLLLSQHEPFHADTVANVREVLAVCEHLTKIPEGVKKGYWQTVVLRWTKFELEVFEDRIEVYRFHDNKTDICDEAHAPGQSFTPGFLAELKSVAL